MASRDPWLMDDADMAAGSDVICRRVFVTGRVQGVFFRANTRDKAQTLGLKGWVRNRWDGRVEILVWGPTAAVQELIRWCHRGPAHAHVTHVEVQSAEPEPGIHHFGVR